MYLVDQSYMRLLKDEPQGPNQELLFTETNKLLVGPIYKYILFPLLTTTYIAAFCCLWIFDWFEG
jgi:hypothetical protein